MVDRHRVHAELGPKPPHGQGAHPLFIHQFQRSVEDSPPRQRLLSGPWPTPPIALANSPSSQNAPPPRLILHRMINSWRYTMYGFREVRWSVRWRARLRWWQGELAGRGEESPWSSGRRALQST